MLNRGIEERKAAASGLYRRSQETVGRQQLSWKLRSWPCRRETEEEAAARRSPMDAASIQPYWSRSSLLEKHGQKF